MAIATTPRGKTEPTTLVLGLAGPRPSSSRKGGTVSGVLHPATPVNLKGGCNSTMVRYSAKGSLHRGAGNGEPQYHVSRATRPSSMFKITAML